MVSLKQEIRGLAAFFAGGAFAGVVHGFIMPGSIIWVFALLGIAWGGVIWLRGHYHVLHAPTCRGRNCALLAGLAAAACAAGFFLVRFLI